jgi:hypothetical protein
LLPQACSCSPRSPWPSVLPPGACDKLAGMCVADSLE